MTSAPPPPRPSARAAFLRGINVGGHKKIGMADLRSALAEAGAENVATHLQSGNVVLDSDAAPADVAATVAAVIADRFGLEVDVLVRTGGELAEIVAANPLGRVADDGSKQLVVFLSDAPDPAAARALADEAVAPEECVLLGRELHVWCPDGLRASRVFKVLPRSKLAPVATARNWNTVTRVLEMACG
jgi:uncharacterized protein (DUF1697 family)